MCRRYLTLATNLSIDEKLLLEAQKISGLALREYIQRRKQTEITQLFGKIIYEKQYNYKALRHRK